jgi:hypothetical protein
VKQLELGKPFIKESTQVSTEKYRVFWGINGVPYYESQVDQWPTEHYMAYLRWKKRDSDKLLPYQFEHSRHNSP